MKLSIKDIKSKLSQKPQIVKPQQEKFENFRVGEIDLAPHQITDDVWLVKDYVTPELEEKILNLGVYNQPASKWVKLRSRSLQLWGGNVSDEGLSNAEPLPKWLDIFAQRLFDERIFPLKPNHVLINEYSPGEGIMPHTDGSAYYPLVATLSLSSQSVVHFWSRELRAPNFSIIMPQRSLLLFTGESYYNMLHSIEAVPLDYVFTDSCGIFYTQTADNQLSRLLNYTGPTETTDILIKKCPNCQGDLQVINSLYRQTRVSLTIRYVPIS